MNTIKRRPLGEPPNAALYYDPDPVYLRELIAQTGLSQNAAARQIGVSERSMRDYLNPGHPSNAPYPVQLALESLVQRG